MNQSWYDHLTPGKIKYGDLRYLFYDDMNTISKVWEAVDPLWFRKLRRFNSITAVEKLLQAAIVKW